MTEDDRNDADDRLDRELRAAFTPPSDRELEQLARAVAEPAEPATDEAAPAGPRPGPGGGPWFALAAAAAVIVVVLLGWPDPASRSPAPTDSRALGVARSPAELGSLWLAAYHDAAARDFTGGCCEPAFDLRAACVDEFATRVGLADGARLQICGSYCGLDTGGCVALIARDGELPMCVYIVRRAGDPGVELPAGSGLQLTRRELGPLVLYALAPAPAAAALDAFVSL